MIYTCKPQYYARDGVQEEVGYAYDHYAKAQHTIGVQIIDGSDESDVMKEHRRITTHSPKHDGSVGMAFHLVECIYIWLG